MDFSPLPVSEKAVYDRLLSQGDLRGCEYNFTNLYLWGRQSVAEYAGNLLFFNQFDRQSVYLYPVGQGDRKAAIDAIIADAQARSIPCRLTSLLAEDAAELEALYPGRFCFHSDRDSFDYVYAIEDLAQMRGRKYQAKRNHIHRFYDAYPDCTVCALTEAEMPALSEFLSQWYEDRLREDPHADFHAEQIALRRAMRHYAALGMDGIYLRSGEKILAMAMGSPLSARTYDIQFEKAAEDIDGAYPAVCQAFARYLSDKYPAVAYLNREDDLGIEGLRKSKLSYHPHHMIEKKWAHLREEGYDD